MTVTELEVDAGSLSEYYDWFSIAETGDLLVYWVGDLAYDRDEQNHRTRVDFKDKRSQISALDALATRIRKDAEDGFLILTQKKINNSLYEYRAARVRAQFENRNKKVTSGDGALALA